MNELSTRAGSSMGRVVLVCKSGGEYLPLHANWLARQFSNPVTVLTDFCPTDFDPAFDIFPLRYGWRGWWSKMELFRPDFLHEKFVFFDLDTVVREVPSSWFLGEEFMAISPFNKWCARFASGVMMIPPVKKEPVWKQWISAPARHMENFRGDQDFLEAHVPVVEFFPTADLSSYKITPHRNSTAKVVCFHGRPRPWHLTLPWIPPLHLPVLDHQRTAPP